MLGNTTVIVIVAFFLIALGYGGRATFYPDFCFSIFGVDSTEVYGLVLNGGTLGIFIGPLLTAWAPSYNVASVIAAAGVTIGVCCMLSIRVPRER